MRYALLPVLAVALCGCPIGNDKFAKPKDLSPVWLADKLRVLAVRADPPEVGPGEAARFEALVADPEGVAGAVVWIACPPEDAGGIGFGCTIDPSMDFTTATPEELADAGFIGIEPFLEPVFTPAPDILDGLDEREARDGLQVLVQVTVLPDGALDSLGDAGVDFDFNEVEAAYKRLIVSSEATPNTNPELSGFLVDGLRVANDAVVEVDRNQLYSIAVTLESGAVERYTYINPDGDVEDRVEEPFVSWYTTSGQLGESDSLFPYLDAGWQAPDEAAASGTWWAVIRDRRGGMSWLAQPWRVRGE